MTTLDEIKDMFAAESQPEDYTDYKHCEECAEHNETLKKYDRYAIPLEELNNPGWDPICFVKPEAFRYVLPRLCELAYGAKKEYYLDQFLFHLENNADLLTKAECEKVYELLEDIYSRNSAEIDANLDKPDIDRVGERLTT